MGSACFLKNINFSDCCSNKNMLKNLTKSDQVLTKDIPPNEENKDRELKNKNSDENKLSGIIKYFNTEEKEILAEYYKHRDKEKNLTKNRDNNKYELMLKRLLEQQTIKRVGPKRRQTIRNGGEIMKIVKQIIQENKEEALRTTNTKEKESEDISLLVTTSHKKGRNSQNFDKNILMKNKFKKNCFKDNS